MVSLKCAWPGEEFAHRYLDQVSQGLNSSLTYSFSATSITTMAGRRGLMESTLGSGDRVRGFKSRSRRSGFFWAFFFFFLLTSLSLTYTGIILDHKVTHSGRDKERKKTPSSAICAANAEIRAMYGRKKECSPILSNVTPDIKTSQTKNADHF